MAAALDFTVSVAAGNVGAVARASAVSRLASTTDALLANAIDPTYSTSAPNIINPLSNLITASDVALTTVSTISAQLDGDGYPR